MSEESDTYDVLIAGAGPAGASCALQLADAGLKIALVDKAVFPRDKICGDALSVDVVNQLPKVSDAVAHNFNIHPERLSCHGIRIFSPDVNAVEIPFFHQGKPENGYVFPRLHFDNLFIDQVKKKSSIQLIENCNVISASRSEYGYEIETSIKKLQTKMLVGADGAQSVVRKIIDNKKIDRKHYSAGLRMYYEGVQHFHERNYIDLYFFKEILPGYLWVFPLTHGQANVGLGVLSSKVSRRKLDLRKTLQQLIVTHPELKKRFEHARPLEPVKGFGLPLGSEKRKLSGERMLLLGDAAGLIDPFSGEGIANAIRSGRLAAEHLKKCFSEQNFSAAFNKAYDQIVYRKMNREFQVSKTLQRLCQYPFLFNYVVKKANRNTYWHQFLINALDDIEQKNALTKPSFYYKLFFSRG